MAQPASAVTPELRPYQQDGVDFLRQAKRAILADDPGIGKSAQALTAAEGRTLVVSAAMLEDTWKHEHLLWRPDLDLTWTSYQMLFERESTGVLSKVNHTCTEDCTHFVTRAVPKAKQEWLGFDTVIFDEAHELKNRKANQTLAAMQIVAQAERLYMLTGTPLPNYGHEIYMALRLIYGKDDRRFSSYWRWANTWFDVNETTKGRKKGQSHKVIGDLRSITTWEHFAAENGIEGRWLKRHRGDVLTELPPLVSQDMYVPMVPKQAKAYGAFKRDWFVDLDGHELATWDEGGVWIKLLRLSTGLEVENPEMAGSAKLEALVELLRERKGQQTLVWGWFRDSLEAARHKIHKELGVDALVVHGGNKGQHREILKSWKLGKVPVLLGSIRLLKEGLTLTETDTAIFLEHSAVPSHNEQAIYRHYRMGQTRPCSVVHLYTEGTVDARLAKLLVGKTDQQARAIKAFDLLG